MIVNKYVLIFCEPLHFTYMENASFVNMEPILVPGDKINHTDFVGDQSKLFFYLWGGGRSNAPPPQQAVGNPEAQQGAG